MGKIKLPKSLLRLLFPKKRKSSPNNKADGHGGNSSSVSVSQNIQNNNNIRPSSRENECFAPSPALKNDNNFGYKNNIAVIENDDITDTDESTLSIAPSLPSIISLDELLHGSSNSATVTNIIYNDSEDDDDDENEDLIFLPLKMTAEPAIHTANADGVLLSNVITPPSSPGQNDASNGNNESNNDEKGSVGVNPIATTISLQDHSDQDIASRPPPPTTTVNETIHDNHNNQIGINQIKKKKSSSSSRVQFSLHGEEARQRAMARQRKILSKAHLRLDSISETSLEMIMHHPRAPSSEEADEEFMLLLGDSSSSANSKSSCTKQKRHHHRHHPRQQFHEEKDNDVAVSSSSASSVASIASSSYSWGRGKNRGNVSSYIFYESPTMPQKKSSSSVSLVPSPIGTNVADMTLCMEDSKDDDRVMKNGRVGTVESTKENICNHSAANTMTTTTTTTKHSDSVGKNDDASLMQFFILLLCPTSRIFELLQINDYYADITSPPLIETTNSVTIQDILSIAIPKHCTDERLMLQKYAGLVRAEDRREFVDLNAKAFFAKPSSSSSSSSDESGDILVDIKTEVPTAEKEYGHRIVVQPHSSHFIQRNDLLVAILEGYTGYQMAKISKPILRNSKFCEMIRRRSGGAKVGSSSSTGGGSDGDAEDAIVDGGKHAFMLPSGGNKSLTLSRHKEEGGGCAVGDGRSSKSRRNKKGNTKARSAASAGFKDDAYLSLCQQLKQLSKKLHIVDDEIAQEYSIALPESPAKEDEVAGRDGQEVTTTAVMATRTKETSGFPNFKMTPKMVAYELAMNIEDIFADHDVDIMAVDADDDDDDETTMAGFDGETIDAELDDKTTDDDTFVSARSMRSLHSSRSMRSVLRKNEDRSVIVANDVENDESIKPVMEITTKRKDRKGRTARGNRASMFDNYEEDDMMLQIEAMARQAESEFESRRKGAVVNGTKKNEVQGAADGVSKNAAEVQDSNGMLDGEIDIIPNITGDSDNDDDDIVTSSPIPTHKKTPSSQTEHDALARSFLNASTTMVSTMVAASQGRVNEVHVLQYLGVTIVCIAANFMNQARAAGSGSPGGVGSGIGGGDGSGFGARDVLQSAMFLAFMVNGQRYMAKVTKK